MAFLDNKKKKRLYVRITAVIFLLTLIFTLFIPLKYSATTSLLVVQKGDIDISQIKTGDFSEQQARNLAQVVYTSNFFYQVMDTGYDVSPELFSADENVRKKQWQRSVKTDVKRNTGILELKVYHPSSYTARELANAIAYALTLHGQEYTGLQNTEIKLVDEVIVSKIPVRPNLILVGFLGLVLGSAVSFSAVTLIEEKEKKQFLKEEKTVAKQPAEKTVNQLVENETVEQAFEQTAQKIFDAPSYSQYARYPEEIMETMPRR